MEAIINKDHNNRTTALQMTAAKAKGNPLNTGNP